MIKIKSISKLYWYYLKYYFFSRNWVSFLIKVIFTIFIFYLLPIIITYATLTGIVFKNREEEWKKWKSECSRVYYSSSKTLSEKERDVRKIINKGASGANKKGLKILDALNLVNKDILMFEIFGHTLKEIIKNSPKINAKIRERVEEIESYRKPTPQEVLKRFFSFFDVEELDNFEENFNLESIKKTIEFYENGFNYLNCIYSSKIQANEHEDEEDEENNSWKDKKNKYVSETIKTWKDKKSEIIGELKNELELSEDTVKKIKKDISLDVILLEDELEKETDFNRWEKIFEQTSQVFFGFVFTYIILSFFDLFFEAPKQSGEESLILIFTPGVTREEIIISKFLALITCLSIFSFCTVVLPLGFLFLTKNEIFPIANLLGDGFDSWDNLLYIWDSKTNILLFLVMILFLQPIICSLLVFPYVYIRQKLSRLWKTVFNLAIMFRAFIGFAVTAVLFFLIKNLLTIKIFLKIRQMKDRPLYFVFITPLIGILFCYLYYRVYKKEDLSITTAKTE